MKKASQKKCDLAYSLIGAATKQRPRLEGGRAFIIEPNYTITQLIDPYCVGSSINKCQRNAASCIPVATPNSPPKRAEDLLLFFKIFNQNVLAMGSFFTQSF